MKLKLLLSGMVVLCSVVLFSFYSGARLASKKIKFPYKKEGLNER
jgi:hypothetical protein